ncbi:hypothetical protein [Kitasatospora purpeofusca]|uniref:Chorismate lyase n=1 Tax=Kitasatospora purpeofusca TaxID=67352 RepID=A0ABZ1UEL0_9ACTN|nr:hypothetical protein [Kitasatospora purpeofusca]
MSPAGPAAGQLPVDRLSAFGRLLVTTELSTDALPGPVHRDLTTTSEPIGRVLRRRRVETFRELLCIRVLFGGEGADPLDQAHAWARASGSGRGPDCGPNRGPDRTVTGAQRVYRVFIGGRPAMVVGEVFTAACLRLSDAPAPDRHQSAAKGAT